MADQKIEEPIKKMKGDVTAAAQAESEPAPVRRYRAVLFQGALILVVITFAGLTFLVKTTPFFAIDLQITQSIQAINFPIFGSLMSLVSWPGFAPQSFLLVGVFFLVIFGFGLRWEAVSAVIASLFSTAINVLVKDLIQRPRPTADLANVTATLQSYSFPSGHVMFYFCYFGFLWFLAYSLLKPSLKRNFLLVFFGLWVALIGISRVYLGQHWASDVLGAYLLSSLTMVVIVQFYRWGKTRFFVNQPVAPEVPKQPIKNKS
jgi:membrane-associated phospholipid phosphatase